MYCQLTISPQPTAVVREGYALTITCQQTNQVMPADLSFTKVSDDQNILDTSVASPFESFNRCTNLTSHQTAAGYFIVCDFSTNTVQLLIQSPVQGDVYYCVQGNDETQRTTVSVAGKYKCSSYPAHRLMDFDNMLLSSYCFRYVPQFSQWQIRVTSILTQDSC